MLHPSRGILPENVWNHVQLTHFNRLELRGKMEATKVYTSQGSLLVFIFPVFHVVNIVDLSRCRSRVLAQTAAEREMVGH